MSNLDRTEAGIKILGIYWLFQGILGAVNATTMMFRPYRRYGSETDWILITLDVATPILCLLVSYLCLRRTTLLLGLCGFKKTSSGTPETLVDVSPTASH